MVSLFQSYRIAKVEIEVYSQTRVTAQSINLPTVDPILQWYFRNPPLLQVVPLTSDVIPAASTVDFQENPFNHTQQLTHDYKAVCVPRVNVVNTG